MPEKNVFKGTISQNFESLDKQAVQVEKYEKGEAFDFYARYGYLKLAEREKEFSEMMGSADCALFNDGMAAIDTAIEAEGLKNGDVVICAKEMYEQSNAIVDTLKNRGVEVVAVDPGNMEEIAEVVEMKKPRLIFLESVANSQDMQVCDIKRLMSISESANQDYRENLTSEKLIEKYFSIKRYPLAGGANDQQGPSVGETHDSKAGSELGNLKKMLSKEISEFEEGNNPFVFRKALREFERQTGCDREESIREISKAVRYVRKNSREKLSVIIDNTLPSPVLYNPLEDAKGSPVELVIVESATKHYQVGRDKITMGIAYSDSAEKIKEIKKIRAMIGSYLQPIAEKEIPKDLIGIMPEIMKRHAENALELAKMLSGSGKVGEVEHPNLPEHAQSELAKEIAPEGLVTLFNIKITDAPRFVKTLKEIAGDKIGLGGSFGHPKTWVLSLGEYWPERIRIAAGRETEKEFKEVLDIFKKALETYET
ncbi:MAG: PLP-dependent transferase [Parcubacteria group bacterium]